jgi:predicted RNase H-like HicB family nuclease
VAVHKDPNSTYGVSVPALPGCISAGSNLDEALMNVREAISLHLRGMAEDGDEIPPPGSIGQYLDDEDYADAICWAIVEVDVPEAAAKG